MRTLAQLTFSTFNQVKTFYLRNSAAHRGLGLPTSVTKKSHPDMITGQLNVNDSSLRLFSHESRLYRVHSIDSHAPVSHMKIEGEQPLHSSLCAAHTLTIHVGYRIHYSVFPGET